MAVADKVFLRDLVKRPIQAALEQGERIFNRVRMRVSDSVGALVIDGLMLSGEFALEREDIYRVFVGVDRANVLADSLFQFGLQYPALTSGTGTRRNLPPPRSTMPSTTNFALRGCRV